MIPNILMILGVTIMTVFLVLLVGTSAAFLDCSKNYAKTLRKGMLCATLASLGYLLMLVGMIWFLVTVKGTQ